MTSPTGSISARSRTGRLYWRVAESLPQNWRPAFAGFAARLRRARSRWRRGRRHLVRTGMRRLARAGTSTGPVASRWARLSAPVIGWGRRLLAVDLPGDGPVTLIDARGLAATEIVTRVDGRQDRFVVVTDDAHLLALREAGLVYEYVPAPATPLAPDPAAQDRLVEDRRPSWVWGYDITRHERLGDPDDAEPNEPAPTSRH